MNDFLKRWLGVLLVVLIGYGIFVLVSQNVYRFNPQYLVETTILKNKSFSKPIEIISPQLKIKAYLYEEHSNPIVSLAFLFKDAGVAYEPNNKTGLGLLLSSMLLKGAGKYKMTQFHDILEQKAIQIDFDNNKDNFEGSLKFIKKDMNIATRMLNQAMTEPLFEAKFFQQGKADLTTLYLRQQEKADSLIALESFKQLFPDHPYQNPRTGTPQTHRRLTVADIREFMRRHLTLNNLIVGISGDITPSEAGVLLDKVFAKLPQTAQRKMLNEVDAKISEPEYHLSKELRQNIGLFFGKGPKRLDEDFYSLMIAMQIFSGSGLTSRVQKACRENEGLTYGVYGSIVNFDKADLIYGRFSATADNFERIKQIIKEEWFKMAHKGIRAEELEQAKNYMIASDALRYADIENISATLVYMQKMHLGLDYLQKRKDYIENVTLEQVNQAIKKYFKPENLRFMTIGETNDAKNNE